MLTLCSGREWSGDLKKLPNIKLRKVSNKGLDTTKDEGQEKDEAEVDDNEEDDDDDDALEDNEELDEMVLMSD